MTFILLILCLHSEVFQLDTVSTNSVDTVTIGATFRGGAETNAMTVITGGRVIQIEIRATDLRQHEHTAPSAREGELPSAGTNLTDGASGVVDRRLVQSNFDAPVGQGQRFDSATIQTITSNMVGQVWGESFKVTHITNDTPVRAWHGALMPPPMPPSTNSVTRVVQLANPPPPLPEPVGRMFQVKQTIDPKAREAMLKHFKNGGQKGRPVPNSMVPTPKWEGPK